MIPISAGILPENAHRVNSCPEAKNKTAWEEASKRLKCEEKSRKNMLYHCLPSTYLNETIEFCGKLTAVSEGRCPIYNYENGATVATSINCSNFTYGCPNPPNPPFHSETFYLYPDCLEINKVARCYYAEPNCPREEKRYDPYTVIAEEISTTRSVVLYTTTTAIEKDTSKPKDIILIVVSVVAVILLAGIIILVFTVRNYQKQSKRNRRLETGRGEEFIPLNSRENSNVSGDGKINMAWCCFKLEDEATDTRLDNQTKENLSDSKEDHVNHEKETNKIKIRLKDTSAGQNKIDKTEEKSLATEKNSSNGKQDMAESNFLLNDEAAVKRSDNQSKENLRNLKEDRNNDEKNTDKSKIQLKYTAADKNLFDKTEGKGSATEEEIDVVEKLEDDVVMEKTVTVEYEASKKLRNENMREVEQCGKQMVVQNPGFVHDLRPRVKYYKLWQKIINEGIFPDLKILFNDGDKSCTDMTMVWEWDRRYNLRENIWILQVLLDICKANHLVSACAEFAKSTDVCYISKDCKENQTDIIYIHTSLEITDKDVAKKMENIRKIIAEDLELKLQDVQLYGLTKGSLIFIFSLPKRILDSRSLLHPSLLESLRESLKKNKVFKVERRGGTTMTGCQRFNIRVHLVCKVNYSANEVRLCIQFISKTLREKGGTNIEVLEDSATVRTQKIHVPKHTESITNELSRKEIQRKKIHEEMEPNADLRSLKENFPEYYNTFELAVRQQDSRKEKSKTFFKCLDKLEEKPSKEIQNFIFGKYAFEGKTLNGRDLSNRKEKIKTIISSQRPTFIDEIDSTFIEDTLKSQVTARSRTRTFQDNKEMSRKDRVNAFLDFVLKNEEYLIPFDDVLNNNEDLLRTIQSSLYE